MDHKTIKCLSARRLITLAKKNDLQEGTALQNIYKIGMSDQVILDIRTCLESENSLDVSTGLYFLLGLLEKYDIQDFGLNFVQYLIKKIPFLIEKKYNSQVRMYSLWFFMWFKDNYPNYREKMMFFLKSEDIGYREDALKYYETYCNDMEVEPLFEFEQDKKVSELSMNGPLIYEFRDMALEKIGKIVNENFMTKKVSEYKDEWKAEVGWYSWEPFWTWWNKRNKQPLWLDRLNMNKKSK